MSSDRVKVLSDLYRFATGLLWGEVSRPDEAQTATGCDQATIDEQNDRDFLLFEAAIPSLPGVYDQLNEAKWDQVSSNQQGFGEDLDIRPLARIETGLAIQLKRFDSRLPTLNRSQASLQTDNERDTADVEDILVRQYVTSMFENGTIDPHFQQGLVPSVRELRDEVAAMAGLNEMVERLPTRSPRPAERGESDPPNRTVTESEDEKSPSESLFDHLALRNCCYEEHGALLQLSEWNMRQDPVFHIFLSCCKIVEPDRRSEEYHKTKCTLERRSPGFRTPLDVCVKAKEAQEDRVPLLLSFNSSRIWTTSEDLDFLPSRAPSHRSLEALLRFGKFKTDAELKKFRLALRLASSLCHLYLGPWLQHNLTAKDVFVFHSETADPADELEEPYVHCLLQKDWECTNQVTKAFMPYSSDRYCTFFLAFAQLLVDIAKGETSPDSSRNNPKSWYHALADEVKNNFQDETMEDYGSAIKGCIWYLRHYDSAEIETGNTIQRAQQVIRQKIVSPLQKNLSKWEDQMNQTGKFVDNDDEEESLNAVGQARGRPERAPGRQSSTRHQTTAVFTLFSKEDEDYPVMMDPFPTPGEYDFTICMENYLEEYIQKPSKTAFEPVRVDIIDTGFYVDDDDTFLQGAEDRVIESKCFVGSSDSCTDSHGHGTQVARLLLKHAPQAEIYVAKISNSRTFNETNVEQLVEALRWAGTRADIINLSFGLGQNYLDSLTKAIDDLVKNKKLIFAAASNNGGNGSRPWPAKQPGVFCIHATNERGWANHKMNPTAMSSMDNFATLGENIESFWRGQKRCISGTSFATPVAAAIAANVLHFARAHLKKEDAAQLMRYYVMKTLMRNRMTDNGGSDGVYHYVKPWADELWAKGASDEDVVKVLLDVITYGR